MGHYASEMQSESREERASRKKYWSTRKKLENLPASALTVGKMHKALELLSDKQTPSHSGFSSMFVQERLKKMEALMPKKRVKKPAQK